jgi:hypothetical protein
MPRRHRGTILGFSGQWQSGIAQLAIGRSENGRNIIEHVIPCENGPTARALIAAFDCGGAGALHRQPQALRSPDRVHA